MKIKKGDTVLIISGKDKKKKGKVLRTFPKQGKILVEGINLKKKHVKPKKESEKGQIVEKPYPMYASCAKLFCPTCQSPTRVGFKIVSKGEKRRICKKCKAEF